MGTNAKPCLSCGKPTYSGVRLHPACKYAVPVGAWSPGLVQTFKERQAASPRAPLVSPGVWDRLATLTKTEAEVLRLLAYGHDPEDVSAIRTTALGTTRSQIKAIRRKLLGLDGQGTYALAVALAWRSGWITVSDEAQEGAA